MKSENQDKEQFEKILKAIIASENPNNTDRGYRMAMARMKLELSKTSIDSLLWVIRFFIRTHDYPQEVFNRAIQLKDENQEDTKLIAIVMENELEIRQKELVKEKDRK